MLWKSVKVLNLLEVNDGEDEKEEKVEKVSNLNFVQTVSEFLKEQIEKVRTWRGIYTFKFKEREIKDTFGGEEENEREEAGKNSTDKDEKKIMICRRGWGYSWT